MQYYGTYGTGDSVAPMRLAVGKKLSSSKS